MNVNEIMEYIDYLEAFREQLIQDQAQYFRQQIDVLKTVTTRLNETLSLFAYATVYNEGELRFPKSYFELHQDMNYNLVFDQDSDSDFVIVKVVKLEKSEESEEVEEDGEIESVPAD